MARKRLVVVGLLFATCQMQPALPDGAECWSLSGRALYAPELSPDLLKKREANLAAARTHADANPQERDAAIWVGRRLGYLGRYREAIAIYTEALRRWPGDAFLLRHRGHRLISVRDFARAQQDLRQAALACRTIMDEVEPDGLPVPGRPPHSTLHFNVHYHGALASFLLGDFEDAEGRWLDCLAVSTNDESRVAVTHWLWSTRMRLGDLAGAADAVRGITADMDIVENKSYHQLCLLYNGKLKSDRVQIGEGSSGAALQYGLAHYRLVTMGMAAARPHLEVLAADAGWASFGVIAAEAELARAR